MSGIICAIRGGPDSQPTIEKGIALAQEANLPLHFLYVVNLNFLSHTQSSKTSTISDQLTQMGEFILLTAQEKAAAAGVSSQADIRHGNVGEEIINIAKELQADYFVLGLPVGDDERNVFIVDRMKEFGQRIEEESGAKVILAGGVTSE
jgi:nucleotide-binding universal stress UspA family protein